MNFVIELSDIAASQDLVNRVFKTQQMLPQSQLQRLAHGSPEEFLLSSLFSLSFSLWLCLCL